MNKKKLKPFLSPMAIIFFLLLTTIVISWILYWSLPSDKYDFHPAGLLEVFTAPIKGFVNSATTLIFLLFVGAYMHLLETTHSIDALISRLFIKLRNKELFFIGIIFVLFAILGSFLGAWSVMALPFYFLIIPLLTSAGYDKFTSFLIVFFASEIGVFASTINPILISNAIDATNVAVGSIVCNFSDGILWRFISFFVMCTIGLIFTLNYAKKHKNVSLVTDLNLLEKSEQNLMTGKKKATLWIMFFTFSFMFVAMFPWDNVAGLNGFELLGNILAKYFPYLGGQTSGPDKIVSNIPNIGSWSLLQISFLFFVSMFITSLINWKGEKEFGNDFVKGAKTMIPVVFIISLASGISVILDETGLQKILIDTISSISNMNPILLVFVMFLILTLVSLFIPSIASMTKAVYPTLGPSLATGNSSVSVSSSILCASFGNGLIHLFTPISTMLIYGLNKCEISFKEYYKKIWIVMLVIFGSSIVLLFTGTTLPNKFF